LGGYYQDHGAAQGFSVSLGLTEKPKERLEDKESSSISRTSFN
jgi:hypothetical protein